MEEDRDMTELSYIETRPNETRERSVVEGEGRIKRFTA